ncbi:MAG TPA: ATP-dependent helicase HrpB [Candidatus Binatia bacterium]|nr:ATP-dependent helicase HrpB [Candidatus Binatia bacterium]
MTTTSSRESSRPATQPLPIDPLLPAVVDALRTGSRLVLRAAPGAGKTTRVPAALLDAGVAPGRVLVLEPRRIAARAAAEFVARARGGSVGAEVGYRVRFEQRGGSSTRLWFLTEGVFGRQLTDDPFLDGVGVVVLDEFHERHLQGDLALAVVRELQETVRPDLKLVVMSATLETEALARYLPDATVLTSEGRAFPVTMSWAPPAARQRLHEHIAAVMPSVIAEPGDVLVFLPGAGDIRRTAEMLSGLRDVDIVPLHGDQPLDEQQRALRPGPRRRIVLATNVAETALTVEGVTAVVDSGVARAARFDPRHGLDRLVLAPISRASAEQRAGRAGRLGPGRCVRLWSREEHGGRRAHETPEILRLDLTRTVLELRAWGLGDTARLAWLDAPPPTSLAHAEALLVRLGAVDTSGALTSIGRRLLALPASPRLARMQIEAEAMGCGGAGALLAALAGERDILLGGRAFGGPARDFPPGPSDLLLRMELFEDAERRGFSSSTCHALGLDGRAVRAVERARRQLARGMRTSDADPERLMRCALAGFPDRVARRRAAGSERAVMVGGIGVALAPESVVREVDLFVAVDLESGRGPDALVRVASAVRREWLEALFPDAVRRERTLVFDPARGAVVEQTQERYLDVVLSESVRTNVDRAEAGPILAAAVTADADLLAALAADAESQLERLRFLATAMPELGLPIDPMVLFADAIAACAEGHRSLAELRVAGPMNVLRGLLTHAQRSALDRDAPTHFKLPTERMAPITYEAGRPPSVSARIQELFGLTATPRLAAGRVPLVVQLLAPNQRPVQITDDLASFWRTTYVEVRKQLRGRYPRHPWPDDPLTAPPTARIKRRPS